MRRSRIKVMATVPARRKPTRETEPKPNDCKSVTCQDSNDGTVTTVSTIEEKEENFTENVNNHTTKDEIGAEPQQRSIIPQIADIKTLDVGDELPASPVKPDGTIEENHDSVDKTIVEKLERAKNAAPESASKDNQVPEQSDSCEPQELKTPSIPESTAITKVSQTRTSFMRPTPRLDGGGRVRRNSVHGSGASASESEDDCRRASSVLTNRMRNDSLSSVQSPKRPALENSSTSIAPISGSTGGPVSGTNSTPGKNSSSFSARQKRKSNKSESARKLAEARREFLMKYEHKQPDRTKLTMYDLIYYNPMTNPLKKSEASLSAVARNSSAVQAARMEEDEEDDDDDCEGNEAMPMPQVKVGPDGHLVLDERSLVIEHTGAKKSRQALARTEALVDEDNNGTGFYKKRQKKKDWPKWETLKFYKALNTVGTDFLLMQSFFPQRTRQEIKLKFKKEERINRRFVEKALVYHQEFDIDSLTEDLATFEGTEFAVPGSVKREQTAAHQGRGPKRKKNRSRRMVALSIAESTEELEEHEVSVEETLVEKVERKKGGTKRPLADETWLRTESTDSSNGLESDPEIYQVKPTRSGRLPKVRKLQAPKINTLDNLFSDQENEIAKEPSSPATAEAIKGEERLLLSLTDDEVIPVGESVSPKNNVNSEQSQDIENSMANIAQVEPGSLVIVSRESVDEPGETVLHVYMVSSDMDEQLGTVPASN